MTRLVYIANIRLPTEKAHGLQIMKTCEALVRQGIELELIVPKRLNRLKDDPFEFYGVEKKFIITRVRCWDLISWKIFGALGFWIESWTFYRSVKKYLRSSDSSPRVLGVRNDSSVAYYTRDLPIAYWLSKDMSPVYYEIHTLPEKADARYEEAWNRCKGLIVISDGLKQELVRQGIVVEKILVARDAVDLKEFLRRALKEECRKKLGLPLDKKIIVYTGHLYEWKGAGLVAEATRLLSTNSDIEVYVVGGTSKDIDSFRKKFGAIKHLYIVGWQSHRLIPYWNNAADVLVVPTSAKEKIGAVYTSPMKLFEYMMAKRPVVASDIPSLREVLDESTAFFFKPDDPSSLAETLKKVVANYAEAEVKAAKAYEEVVEKYSWEKRAEQIKNFILTP